MLWQETEKGKNVYIAQMFMIMYTSLVLSMWLNYTNYANQLTIYWRWFEKHYKIDLLYMQAQ